MFKTGSNKPYRVNQYNLNWRRHFNHEIKFKKIVLAYTKTIPVKSKLLPCFLVDWPYKIKQLLLYADFKL